MRGFALIVLCLVLNTNLNAQLTALAVTESAKSVIGRLEQVATTVGEEARITSNNVASNLKGLIDQLEKLGEELLKKPLDQLSIDVQNTVYKLQSMVEQIDSIISWQRECLFRHAEQFMAGLESIILLSTSNLNFIGKKSMPRLTSVSFINSPSSIVVPEDGGRVKLKGHKLNPHGDKPELRPIVRILNKDMVEISTNLKPSNGASEDEYMIEIEKSVIDKNLGKNIFIEVTPKKRSFLNSILIAIGLKPEDKKFGPFLYPIMIPSKFLNPVYVKIYTNSTWSSVRQVKEERFSRHYDFRNEDCGVPKRHNFRIFFNEIPSNGKIISGEYKIIHEEFVADGGMVPQLALDPNADKALKIDAAVGRPRCVPLIGNVDDAQLIFDVWPIVEYKQSETKSYGFESPSFLLKKNITQNFSVQVGNQNLDQLEVWSEVFINGNLAARSQRVNLGNGTRDALVQRITTKEGYVINVSKTGIISNNKINVSFSVEIPPACTGLALP